MFHFDDQLIQIQLGSQAYELLRTRDNRGFFEKLAGVKAPEWTKDLKQQAALLREACDKKGIILPGILFSTDTEMPVYQFRITMGVEDFAGDIRKDDLFELLVLRLNSYQIPDPTKEGVKNLCDAAIGKVLKKDFQEAMNLLLRLYYWSTLLGCQKERVISLLNMAGISLLNNKLGGVVTTVQQALLIVEKPDFYDPYLKYHAHICGGNLFALHEEYALSVRYFEQAEQDIIPSGEIGYLVDALYNEASVLMAMGEYQKCSNILDKIVTYIRNRDDYGKEILLQLYEMRMLVSDLTVMQLQQKLDVLMEEYTRLSRSFLSKVGESVVAIVSQCGPYLVTAYAGSLMGGTYIYNDSHATHIIQKNTYGGNVFYR